MTLGPTSPRPASPVRNYHPQVSLSGIGSGGGARGESQAFPDPLATQNGNVGQSRWVLQTPPGARADSSTPLWVSTPGEYGVAIAHRRSARQFLAPNVKHVRGARERGQGLEISGYSEEDLRRNLEVLGKLRRSQAGFLCRQNTEFSFQSGPETFHSHLKIELCEA